MASGFQTFSNARHRARQIRRLHRLLRFQHGSERFSFVACPAEHPHRHRLCGVDRHWRVGHVPGWYSVVRGFFQYLAHAGGILPADRHYRAEVSPRALMWSLESLPGSGKSRLRSFPDRRSQ